MQKFRGMVLAIGILVAAKAGAEDADQLLSNHEQVAQLSDPNASSTPAPEAKPEEEKKKEQVEVRLQNGQVIKAEGDGIKLSVEDKAGTSKKKATAHKNHGKTPEVNGQVSTAPVKPGKERRTALVAESKKAPEAERAHLFFARVGVITQPSIMALPLGLGGNIEGGMNIPLWVGSVAAGFNTGFAYLPQATTPGKVRQTFGFTLTGRHVWGSHNLLFGGSYMWGYNPAAPSSMNRSFTVWGPSAGYGYDISPAWSVEGQLRYEQRQLFWTGNDEWTSGVGATIDLMYKPNW